MKATIIDTHHTVLINNEQVDLIYNFIDSTLTCFIDARQVTKAYFKPSRMILSYTNVMEVASYYYDMNEKRKSKEQKQQQRELQEENGDEWSNWK
jgi:hypothetical protein